MKKMMKDMGFTDWFIDMLVELNEAWKTGYGAIVEPDVEMILLRPATSFEQFCKEYADKW